MVLLLPTTLVVKLRQPHSLVRNTQQEELLTAVCVTDPLLMFVTQELNTSLARGQQSPSARVLCSSLWSAWLKHSQSAPGIAAAAAAAAAWLSDIYHSSGGKEGIISSE